MLQTIRKVEKSWRELIQLLSFCASEIIEAYEYGTMYLMILAFGWTLEGRHKLCDLFFQKNILFLPFALTLFRKFPIWFFLSGFWVLSLPSHTITPQILPHARSPTRSPFFNMNSGPNISIYEPIAEIQKCNVNPHQKHICTYMME